VALIVLPAEFLGGLVELNLCSLRFGDFLLEVRLLATDLDSELFYLEVELLDLRAVLFMVLLQGNVVFFLLLTGYGPLLQLFLIPVQLQF